MGITAFRALPATDRLLALALTLHESRIDPSHGQRKDLALDPDLADQWGALAPVQDYAALAMARIADTVKSEKHPEAYRFVVGLNAGWEDVKAERVKARQDEALRSETN